MDSPPRLRASRFVVAVAGSVVLVLSAPFIGYVRAWIRSQFPGRFVPIVGGLIALLGLTAIGLALARVRERRAIRYTAIAGSLTCAAVYSIATATGVPEVDVVQRFHFIEYGLITFLFYRAWRPLEDPSILILPVLASLIVGTADEWLQWFIPNRVGELDDIFLNGIAIACGLVFSLGTDPPAAFHRTVRLLNAPGALHLRALTFDARATARPRRSWSPAISATSGGGHPPGAAARLASLARRSSGLPGSLQRIGRFGAAFVVALAAFFHTVHLGHDIHDEEIGVFKSRYSKDRLSAMTAEKLEEWRVNPLPLALRRVSREDQYMSEGVTHVQERNEHARAGDVAAAWKENRILEKYYAPVLDTPSYVDRKGHRWSPEQRRDLEARLPSAPTPSGPYVSAANPYPIYAWRPARFWAVTLALAALILAASAQTYRFLPPLRMGS